LDAIGKPHASAIIGSVSLWVHLLNGLFMGKMYSRFFNKEVSQLVNHDGNVRFGACTTKQLLPKKWRPDWGISSHKAGPFDRSTVRHKGCLFFRRDFVIELRPVVSAPNPEHEWFAPEHDTPAPIFSNDRLRFVPQRLELDANPFRQFAPITKRIGLLVFSRIDLKEIASKQDG
jgi:hypothetical protein